MRPRVVRPSNAGALKTVTTRDAHVLALVNGTRTVKEIVDASKLRPPDTAAALQRLMKVGLITV